MIAKNIFKLNEQIIAEHQIAAGTEHVNTAHIYCTTVSVGQDLARLSSPRPGLSHSCDGGVGPGATVSPVRWLAHWLLAAFGSSWAVGLRASDPHSFLLEAALSSLPRSLSNTAS